MILCADDYGLRDDINRAILELVEAGRLSAVSCLVAHERCAPAALAELCARGPNLDLGLHLCLTDENLPLAPSRDRASSPRRLPSFGALLRRAVLGRVRTEQVAAQVAAQYDLFLQKCGRKPDYIDGHLHAHQLPGMRQGLLQFLASLPPGSRPYVRNTWLPARQLRDRGLPWAKAAFIGAFGARLLKQLTLAGNRTNDGFAGIYDFRRWPRYGDYFPKFLACLPNRNGILVVHPGEAEPWRAQELRVLREFAFAKGEPNRFQAH